MISNFSNHQIHALFLSGTIKKYQELVETLVRGLQF